MTNNILQFWHNNSKIFFFLSGQVLDCNITSDQILKWFSFRLFQHFFWLAFQCLCIFFAKHTIFNSNKLEWYLLQTIWIDLRHAIEKRSKKFDTMKVKIFYSPNTWNHISEISIFWLKSVNAYLWVQIFVFKGMQGMHRFCVLLKTIHGYHYLNGELIHLLLLL